MRSIYESDPEISYYFPALIGDLQLNGCKMWCSRCSLYQVERWWEVALINNIRFRRHLFFATQSDWLLIETRQICRPPPLASLPTVCVFIIIIFLKPVLAVYFYFRNGSASSLSDDPLSIPLLSRPLTRNYTSARRCVPFCHQRFISQIPFRFFGFPFKRIHSYRFFWNVCWLYFQI